MPLGKKGSDRIKMETSFLDVSSQIGGKLQSIEISNGDDIRRRNSSPLPALTSSVDEPSSSEDDSFGSEVEIQAIDRLVVLNFKGEGEGNNNWDRSSNLSPVTDSGRKIITRTYSDSDCISTPNIQKNTNRKDIEEPVPQSLFWSISSLFPASLSTKKSAEDASSNLFCGAQSWCMRDEYQISPIATHKFMDKSTAQVSSQGNSTCSHFPYWSIGEEDENPSSDTEECKDDRHSIVSEPLKCRSSTAFVRRKERIENLRFNLAPFSDDPRVQDILMAKTKPHFPSKKTRSFAAVSSKVSSVSTTQNYQQAVTCSNVTACNGSSHPVWDSEITEDDGICYDSDPGFLMPNRKDDLLLTKILSPKKSNSIPLSTVTSFDEDMSMRLVMNHHFHFVWHRESSTTGESIAPTAVRFWMERGSCIRSALLQPKLSWQNMNDSYGATDEQRYFLRSTSVKSIELLDITKILPMSSGDKIMHPLAKKSRSFVVEASNIKYLFQAKDELERDRIILGLKITIARLGSKIIMGDPNVFEEFFTPKGNEVPGDMPSVLRN